MRQNKPVKITYSLEKELKEKSNYILEIAKRGKKGNLSGCYENKRKNLEINK